MGFGLFFPGLGGRHQVQVDDAFGQCLLVAADLARPTSQVPAGVARTPVQNCSMARWSMFDLADGALAEAGAAYLELWRW